MNSPARVKRIAIRIVTDEYLDLYTLAVTALAVALLGIFGIADVKTLASVTLALLAVLAYSQIRSRRHVADIADAQRSDPLSAFRSAFPDDLSSRRTSASSLLLVGLSMARTVQGGSLTEMRQLLGSGGKIRVLLLDPTNEELVLAASRQRPAGITARRLQRRIQGTLDELTDLRASTRGDLEIRVASFIPHMGFNVIDADTANGVIVAQHYEHRPSGEAAPIFYIRSADGVWYEHFAAEAKRMWDDGIPWPLSAAQRLARSPRPLFQDAFGSELEASMCEAHDLMITGVTRNTLIMSYYSRLEEWLQGGRRIRVVLADPASDAIAAAADRYYAERSPETVRERVQHSLRLLSELRRSTGGTLSVRLTSHPVAIGLVAVDGSPDARSDVSALFIEYYSYRSREEPKFVLQPSDGAWFEHFMREAEALWASGADHVLDDAPPSPGPPPGTRSPPS